VNKCKVCGDKVFAKQLCTKHYMQQRRYNKILERTQKDNNEIYIEKDYAIIVVYDNKRKEKNKVIIDIEDIEKVKIYKWASDYIAGNYYVSTKINHNNNMKMIYLNQHLYGSIGKNECITYYNSNTLDNRKSNLKKVSRAILQQNTKIYKNNTSGVKGVSWCSRDNKWIANIFAKWETLLFR
jgi:hypothetical protein